MGNNNNLYRVWPAQNPGFLYEGVDVDDLAIAEVEARIVELARQDPDVDIRRVEEDPLGYLDYLHDSR